MKVTKLEHAALVVDAGGKTLIVDPGSLTTPVVEPTGVVAIVITHEHADHWTPEQLARITSRNPDAVIFGPPGVAAAVEDYPVEVVKGGDVREIAGFTLTFFGERHAVIHDTLPTPDNVGVLINGTLFYPGDALTVPDGIVVDTLAVPSAAPWLKLGEAIDYVTEVAPKRAFPTHDMLLSVAGRTLYNARLAEATVRAGGEFFPLEPGQSIDI